MSSKMRKILVIPVLLLSVCVALIYKQVPVYAQSTEKQQVPIELELHKQNPEENVPFQMVNMFPGDSKTQYYNVNVSYTGTITVKFQASVREGGEKLGEVLESRVCLLNTGEVLYEGKLANMPELGSQLTTDKDSLTEALTYEIKVGLSTSVGNEYQNKSLTADLSWWAEGAGDQDDPTQPSEPEGGEDPTQPSEPESGENPTQPSEPESGETPTQPSAPESGSLTNPSTGDDSHIMLWLILFVMSVAVLIIVVAGHRRSSKAGRKFFGGIFLALCLVLGLGITSAALIYQEVVVEENLFATGQVKISLNDNKPIFYEDMLLEPGMEIRKGFTLRNDSSCDVHYRLYFSNIEGEFADELLAEVLCGENTIFEGTLADLNGYKSEGAVGQLKEGEISNMTIVLRVPQDCGNAVQGSSALFDLHAEAVQTVNNPDGLFE